MNMSVILKEIINNSFTDLLVTWKFKNNIFHTPCFIAKKLVA